MRRRVVASPATFAESGSQGVSSPGSGRGVPERSRTNAAMPTTYTTTTKPSQPKVTARVEHGPAAAKCRPDDRRFDLNWGATVAFSSHSEHAQIAFVGRWSSPWRAP